MFHDTNNNFKKQIFLPTNNIINVNLKPPIDNDLKKIQSDSDLKIIPKDKNNKDKFTTEDGIKLRGDINICVVGDPATAKS